MGGSDGRHWECSEVRRCNSGGMMGVKGRAQSERNARPPRRWRALGPCYPANNEDGYMHGYMVRWVPGYEPDCVAGGVHVVEEDWMKGGCPKGALGHIVCNVTVFCMVVCTAFLCEYYRTRRLDIG